ncbi:MAG: hypothetical protein AB1342_13830 [Pseudomonadota bacterium]
MTPNQPQAASPVAATPADARHLAESLMQIMTSLLGIVEHETELVRAGNVRGAIALEAKKNEISSQYVNAISKLKGSRDYLSKSAPDLLAALHRHHDVFRSMLQVNLTVLATAHAVSEGIVRGVNGELQRRNLPNGYTAAGHRSVPGPRQVTPLSVSRSL